VGIGGVPPVDSNPGDYASGASGPNPDIIIDGTSKTILILEDVGRGETYPTRKAADPIGLANGNGGYRAGWRWAEPKSGGGISGPHNALAPSPPSNPWRAINNNAVPLGGPADCPWQVDNCGVLDEPFSFHQGGVNAVFADGHVSYLLDSIDPVAMRRLLTPMEGLPVPSGTDF
jgi:prepilin-type processing-associated H-X9-DG protein